MTTYAGEVRIKTRLDSAGINTGLSKVTAMLGKLAVAAGVAFGVQAIVAFSKVSVEAAAKSEAAWTGLGFVLNANNRSLTQAKEFLKDYTSDGLVPLTDAIKAYQNMVMRGYNTGQIEDMLTVMKDAAAFGRQGQYSMGEAIEKSTQGLRMENSILTDSVGIQTNVAKMWEAYAKEIGTTASSLTHAQKLQAEYNGFMKEGGIFAGAAAQYANTYSGRVSQLTTAFYNLKTAVGNAIIPVLNRILPAIINAVNWFTRLFNVVGRVMNALFGTNVGMADTADGAQDAADGTGEMADNLERANKAAKGSLASFDKLNVLNQPEEGGGGGGAGGSIALPVPDTDPVSSALDNMEERIRLFVERIRTFLEPSREPLERLGTAFERLGGLIRIALEWIWNNILVPFGEWLSQEAAPVAIDLLTAALGTLNEIIIALTPFGIWLWDNFLKPIAEWTGGAIIDILTWLAEKLIVIGDWVKEHQGFIETLAIVFLAIKAAILLVTLALGLWNIAAGIGAVVTAGFAGAMAFLTSPITLTIAAIAALIAIGVLLWKNWDKVKEWGINAWEKIKEVWSNAGTWFNDTVLTPIVTFFTEKWDAIKTKVTDIWEDIKTAWQGASTWFNDTVWQPIKDKVSEVWDKIKSGAVNIGTDIANGVISAVNGVIGFINNMINGLEDSINTLIDLVNRLPLINIPHIDLPNIKFLDEIERQPLTLPALATGAVIPANAPFAAILGDQRAGTNIEAPESLLRQIVRDEMRGMNSQPQTIHNVLKLDGRIVYESWDKENRRVGSSLISKGATA